jgi:DNA-binding winged helix-turn-helix (wHTH) protein
MKIRFLLLLVTALGIILVVYSSVSSRGSVYDDTKRVIALRKIAHEVLFMSGDSVSKVLPVKQMSAQEFHIYPEKAFAISPDSFVNIVNKAAAQYGLQKSFTANIVKYQQEETIYGFAVEPFQKDNTAASCLGRDLPEDRYYLSFVFAAPQKSIFDNPFIFLGAPVLLFGVVYFVAVKKRKAPLPPPAADKGSITVKQATYISIGQYRFYPQQQQLELNGERSALTIKETKVLEILANAPNCIIERETIQKEVWENEGVIVTRSLDMFISKLRKKLGADERVKIVNVHGKGYKLEINT